MTDKDVKKTNADQKKLSEDELDNISGGLWGITIWDTCEKRFSFNKCCYNFGLCPNLVAKNTDTRYDSNIEGYMFDYVLSCAKGYFDNVNASTNKLLPNF